MQSVAENDAGWFDRLFAFQMSERLRAGEPFSLNLVKEIFAETARARTTVPSSRDALDIQRIYDVLSPRVPSLLRLHGTDCYTEIFRLIFEH